MTSPWPYRTGSPTTWPAVGAAALGERGSPTTRNSRPGCCPARSWCPTRRGVGAAPARAAAEPGGASRPAPRGRRPFSGGRLRFPRVSLRAGLAIGAIGIVVAGTAAAATLTTIFAPTHVAPVSLSQSDLQRDRRLHGPGRQPRARGLPRLRADRARSGSERSNGPHRAAAQPASSLAEATARGRLSGVTAHPPSRRGGRRPAVHRSAARERHRDLQLHRRGSSRGSSVTLDAGPAVLVQYAGASGTDLPTLGVVTMRRPTALSTGASHEPDRGLPARPAGHPAGAGGGGPPAR